jgi:hypothetical protein
MQYEKIKSNRAAGRDGNSGRLGGGINLGFEAFRLFLGQDGQLGADLGNGHKVYNSHHLSCRRNIHDRFLLGHHLIINSAPAPQPVNNRLALRLDGKEDIVILLKAMAVLDVDKMRSRQRHICWSLAYSSKPTALPALTYNESAMC